MSYTPPFINFNATSPAAPSETTNVHFRQTSGHEGTVSDPIPTSAYVDAATSSTPGVVQPDNTTIAVSGGVISVPTATDSTLGLVQPDGSTITISAGVISASSGSGNATSIQSVPVSATAPTTGQVLEFNGTDWIPTTPSGGGGGSGSGLWAELITIPTLTVPLDLSNNMNQQTSFSATAETAGISVVDLTGKGSDFVEGILDSYPTAPFTATWLQSAESFGSFNNCGLLVADSLTGAVMMFGFRWGSGGPWEPWVLTYSTPDSSPSAPSSPSIPLSGLVWFKYEDDGTNITFSYSTDGVYFNQTYTVAKASSFLGASGFNYLGFGLESYAGVQMSILSFGFVPPSPSGGVPLAISEAPDWPPSSPTPYDDEFTGTSLNTSLWTGIVNGVPNTIQVKNSYLSIICPAHAGDNFTTIVQAIPTPPYTVTAKVQISGFNYNYFYGGLCIMDSSGKTVIFQIQNGPAFTVNHWNSNTSYNAQPYVQNISSQEWYLQITDDGTNLYMSASLDGISFLPYFYSEGRSSFLSAPAFMGLACGSNDGGHPVSLGCDWFRRTA